MTIVRKVAGPALLVLICIIAYANSIGGAFIWDDNTLITENAVIKSWKNLPALFTKENIATFTGKTFHFYRPLQTLTYMTDYAIGGLKPAGYHVTNILLHMLVTLAIFALVRLIFADIFLALVTAALFAVHPIHTEAVAYISGRADPLAALFMLLSFIAYVKCLDRRRFAWYVIAFLAFAGALLSRESSIILPLLILSYHVTTRRVIRPFIFAPMLAIAGGYIVLRLVFLRHLLPVFASGGVTTPLDRVPGAFAALAEYLKLLIRPLNLHMEYGQKLFAITDPIVIGGAAAAVILVSAAVAARKVAGGVFSFGIAWFLIALVPASNIYPVGAYMAEHWLYLPSIGFFLVVAASFRALYAIRYVKWLVVAVVSVLVVHLAYLTILQNDYWKDQIEFYERTLTFSPASIRANNDLAIAYEKMGKHDEAIEIYRELIRIDPKQPDVYVNLAAVYLVTGKIDYAAAMCEKAIALEPVNATAHNNLAVAYYFQRKYDEAITECDLAIRLGYKVNPQLLEMLEPYRK